MYATRPHRQIAFVTSVVLMMLFAACADRPGSLVVTGDGWPDGTRVSAITDDGVTRSILYGGRTRLDLPGNGTTLIVRASAPGHLTALSDTITVLRGASAYHLPLTVVFRKTSGWVLGLAADSLPVQPISTARPDSITHPDCGIAAIPLDTAIDADTVRAAHALGIAVYGCLYRESGAAGDGADSWNEALDAAERSGLDGIVWTAGDGANTDPAAHQWVNGIEAASDRGLACAVRVIVDDEADAVGDLAAALFGEGDAARHPDEVWVTVRRASLLASPTAAAIQESVGALVAAGVPLGRIIVELAPHSYKFRVLEDGDLRGEALADGELAGILMNASPLSAVRLADGTLRLGYGGALYAYDDTASLIALAAQLHAGPLARCRGIVLEDGDGVVLTPDLCERLAARLRAGN